MTNLSLPRDGAVREPRKRERWEGLRGREGCLLALPGPFGLSLSLTLALALTRILTLSLEGGLVGGRGVRSRDLSVRLSRPRELWMGDFPGV